MQRRGSAKRLLRAAGALVAGALAFGAYGASAQSATGGDIHIAVVGAMTGTYSEIGAALAQGAKAGAQEVNDAGGILGRKVVLDIVDTVGDPADAVPAFNKEMGTNHPVGIVGPTTLEIFALRPLINRYKIPDMFNGGSTLFDTNTDPWIWRINASDSQLGVSMAAYAHMKHYKTAALMFSTEQSSQTLKPVVANTFKHLGGKIVADVNVTPNQSSYRSEVLKVVNAHPQVIFTQMEPTTGAVALSNFKEIDNLKIPFIGTDITAGADFIKAVTPKVAHQVMTSVQGSSALTGGGKAFLAYNKKVNHGQPLAGANYAYDAVLDLAFAIDAAGSTKAAAIVGHLKAVSNPPGKLVTNYKQGLALLKAHKKINFDGASGPLDYNKYHNVYGPFDVIKAQPNGYIKTLLTLSAAQLAAASK